MKTSSRITKNNITTKKGEKEEQLKLSPYLSKVGVCMSTTGTARNIDIGILFRVIKKTAWKTKRIAPEN